MADLGGFDADKVEPKTPFEPIPNGKYVAHIIESEQKATKKNDGGYLKLAFEVLEGPYKGRKLWVNLNLHNKNAQAVAIAKAELSAICRATGVMRPKDSCELHKLPITIDVKVAVNKETQDKENKIRGYEKRGSSTAATQDSGGSSAPWKR